MLCGVDCRPEAGEGWLCGESDVEGGEVSLELVRRVWERTAKILFSVVDYDACVDRRDRISPLRVLALWGFIWVVVGEETRYRFSVPEEEGRFERGAH